MNRVGVSIGSVHSGAHISLNLYHMFHIPLFYYPAILTFSLFSLPLLWIFFFGRAKFSGISFWE